MREKGIRIISDGLFKLSNLEILRLSFEGNKFDKNWAKYIVKALNEMHFLLELRLDLYNNHIENE